MLRLRLAVLLEAFRVKRGKQALVALIAIVVIIALALGADLTLGGKHPAAKPKVAASTQVTPKPSPHITTTPKASPSPSVATPHPQSPSSLGTYTVHNGDSLWTIAAQYLHSGTAWVTIYQLNQSKIGSNPSLIHTGLVLQL